MTIAHACALMPGGDYLIEAHDSDRDAHALRALARWMIRFTPRVVVEPPDAIGLDLTGCRGVHPDEWVFAREVIDAVRMLGLSVRMAIAPTLSSAWACARFAPEPCSIIEDDQLEETVRGLPIAALRPEPPNAELCATLGIERIGQVMALPRSSLPARFGHGFVLRLDQLLGRALEIPRIVEEVQPTVVERMFAGPTKRLESVVAGVELCVELICQRLESKGQGARLFVVKLIRSDIGPLTIPLELSRATRDRKHIWAMLYPKVEKAHMGFGVEGVTIHAQRVIRLPHQQSEQWTEGVREGGLLSAEVGQVIDTLASRLGAGRVVQLEARETHIPERNFRAVGARAQHRKKPVAAAPLSPRPTRLFDAPRKARVVLMTPDGPLLSMGTNGALARITTTIGPERIEPEWWSDPDSSARDYFTVQLEDGRWLWVYRDVASREWLVQGEWA